MTPMSNLLLPPGFFSRPSRGTVFDARCLPVVTGGPLAKPEHKRPAPIHLRHRVAGRLRFSIAGLRGDPGLAQDAVQLLEADAAILSARANIACGTIVIRHRLEALADEQLATHLLSLLDPLLEHPDPRSARRHESTLMRRPGPVPPGSNQALSISSCRPLTWPLADLSRRERSGCHEVAPQSSRYPAKPTPKPKAVPIEQAETSSRRRCWLCALSQEVMRIFLKWSLRCWWQDRRRGLSERLALLRTARLHRRRWWLQRRSLASQ